MPPAALLPRILPISVGLLAAAALLHPFLDASPVSGQVRAAPAWRLLHLVFMLGALGEAWAFFRAPRRVSEVLAIPLRQARRALGVGAFGWGILAAVAAGEATWLWRLSADAARPAEAMFTILAALFHVGLACVCGAIAVFSASVPQPRWPWLRRTGLAGGPLAFILALAANFFPRPALLLVSAPALAFVLLWSLWLALVLASGGRDPVRPWVERRLSRAQ